MIRLDDRLQIIDEALDELFDEILISDDKISDWISFFNMKKEKLMLSFDAVLRRKHEYFRWWCLLDCCFIKMLSLIYTRLSFVLSRQTLFSVNYSECRWHHVSLSLMNHSISISSRSLTRDMTIASSRTY